MGKLKVGLIGCGGRQQAHIYHLLDMEDVEIVAIAEPVDERREAAANAAAANTAPEEVEKKEPEVRRFCLERSFFRLSEKNEPEIRRFYLER